MNFHPVFRRLPVWVVIFVPKEAQEVSVVFSDNEGMEHLLDVCHESNRVLAEAY